ncbi:MAG: TolC family outer membrane protein [Burkholderiales bacterium]|nr:TolC family outer membrane protein [Burkholderiales bacterium]
MMPFSLKKSVLVSACAVLVGVTSSASAISLMQAYQAALKNDPLHRGAKAEQQAGTQYEVMGRSGLLPQVQYSYSTSKNKGETITPTVLGAFRIQDLDYTSLTRNVSIRQTLYSMDAYARFEQGVMQTQLSDVQFDARSKDLILRVTNAYMDAKFAEDQFALYSAQRDAYAEQRRANERMFQKGEGTKTDMLETEAKLDVAEAVLLESVDNMQTARNTLAGMLGQDVKQLDRLRDGVSVSGLLQGSLEDWIGTAEKNSQEIVAAQLNVDLAEKEIDKAKAGHMPRLDLSATYNRGKSESIVTQTQDNSTRSIGVQLVIPIYSGGYTNAAYKQAVAHKDKAISDLDATKNKTLVELKKQFGLVRSSQSKIEAFEKSVASATLLVEATKQSIKGGIRINLDLLNAEQALVNAKKDLAQARYSYLMSFLKLKAVAGVVSATDLQTVAGFFSAE